MGDEKREKNNINPELKANIFSKLTFHWMSRTFANGNKLPLQNKDIFSVLPLLQSERLTALIEQQWIREAKGKKNPSLLKTLLKRHLFTLTWLWIAFVIEGILRVMMPYLIMKTSAYFYDPHMSLETALISVAKLFLCHIIYISARSWVYYCLAKLGSTLRVSVSCLIYRKVCRITQSEIGRTNVGHIINLITNDAERLHEYIVPNAILFNVWVIVPASFILTWHIIGIKATCAFFIVILMMVPLQVFNGKLAMKLRERTAPLTDERVKIFSEIISFMKIIKMYGWELMFKDLVEKVRSKENKLIRMLVHIKCLNTTLAFIIPVISLFIVLLTKSLAGEEITSDQIFFTISMMQILKTHLAIFLGYTCLSVPLAMHSLERIQTFLNSDEIEHIEKIDVIRNLCNTVIVNKNFLKNEKDELTIIETRAEVKEVFNDAVTMAKVNVEWSTDSFKLTDVNIKVSKGELIAIVGSVGCGKSTLLMTMIQEVKVKSGTLKVNGTVSFASQIPWIFNGDVQENILFNRQLDQAWLNRVIELCYLKKDIELLPDGLLTIVGERGVQLSGGQRARVSLARAIYGREDIVMLDDPLSSVDSKCAKHIFDKLLKEYLSDRTCVLVTHASQFLPLMDRIIMMEHGKIKHVGTWNEFLELGLDKCLIVDQLEAKERRRKSTMSENTDHDSDMSDTEGEAVIAPARVEEERKMGSVNRSMYFKYFLLGAGYLGIPVLIVAIILPQVIVTWTDQYSIIWANTSSNQTDEQRNMSYKIYTGFVMLGIFLLILKSIIFVMMITRSAKILHNKALIALLRSPLRFFDINPVGVLLNRFSKDTYFMDERFPEVIIEFVTLSTLFSVSVILVAVANVWFLIGFIPLAASIVYTVRYYLKTSVEIRRLEAINRSPVMSHVAETLSGLTTIRAARQINTYESKFYMLRDIHTSCWMMFCASSRWLNFRLDILCLLVIMLATVICVLLKDVIGSSLAGLAIVYINSVIGGFQWCVRQATEAETLMTAIERLYSFSELPSEAPLDAIVPTEKAPKLGIIKFDKVSMKYAPELPYVLYELSFETMAAEKIGIVGRTGAGKSTIIQALFRLTEPEGAIYIDGVLTSDMGLHNLRKGISVIPQESLLFSATLKVNLDPFNEFNDEELWSVLEQVQLKEYIGQQEGKLEMKIQEGGSNLSTGQRQLLCLARALLRNNKILIIDEATANVDEKTDQLIQRTLRKRFVDCTVLTIAHRINTIIDSDRVMVIDEGKLVEFDAPAILLRDQNSIFYSLVKETRSAKNLTSAAEKAFHYRRKTKEILGSSRI